MKTEPSVKEMAALWHACVKFIGDNHVNCEESGYSDQVYENAPDLICDIAEIVGYYEYVEDEE